MVDLLQVIKKKLARKQRGIKLTPGSRFIRGLGPISVKSAGAEIVFIDLPTGIEHTLKRQDFLGVIITRLPYTGTPSDSPLARAWDIAGSRRVDFRLRAMLLRQIAGTITGADRELVDSWIDNLNNEIEPKWSLGYTNAET